ncbi:MAG: DUF5074 domain-containing protein, partial [Bacteroidota bacterium]
NDIFTGRNQRPLGDVNQSMRIIGDRGYIVVNNSGKVEVVDTATLASIATIEGMPSPRYIRRVNGNKAYVTDFKFPGIHIIDLATLQRTGAIPVRGRTEQMAQLGNKVFVTNYRNLSDTLVAPKVLVIDATTDQVIDSVLLTEGPNSLGFDFINRLWVLCDGGVFPKLEAGALHRINPESHQLEASLPFPNQADIPTKMQFNTAANKLYYLNSGVWSMDINTGVLEVQPVIDGTGQTFYGLGIAPFTDDIWVGEAADFVQRGTVIRYSAQGTELSRYEVGVAPSHFTFNTP